MRKLLTFMAHPDDEAYGIGGTLAKYAAEGVEIHIATVTDGSAGTPVEGFKMRGKTITQVRKVEMQNAAKILGAKLHWMGYRDSGMQGDVRNSDPKALINQDTKKIQNEFLSLIKKINPDVVITHDITGGYFHPDHIFISKVVTDVVRSIKSETRPALYHHIIPKWWVLLYTTTMRLQGKDPTKWGHNKDLDLTKAGVGRDQINACIDVWKYWEVKQKASAAHVSQGGDGNILFTIPKVFQRLIVSKECYMRIYPEVENKKMMKELLLKQLN